MTHSNFKDELLQETLRDIKNEDDNHILRSLFEGRKLNKEDLHEAFYDILPWFSLSLLNRKFNRTKIQADTEWEQHQSIKFDIDSWGTVKSLEILPLIDLKTNNPELLIEGGVSYLIKADDTAILFDLGINQKTEHPSPLLQNMKKLGISPTDFNKIFISHRHGDHCGGRKWAMNRTFGLSSIQTDLSHVKAFTPEEMEHPTATTEHINKPTIIGKGIASIGPIVQPMFFAGSAREQSLVVNIEDKGLVLIVGCGHQSVPLIVERTRNLVEDKIPIYGFIGGVHLPFPKFPGKNDWLGLPFYKFTGTRRPIWEPWTNKDVEDAIHSLESCEIVSISTHDSSDESIDQFRTNFGSKFVDLRVGTKVVII